MSRKQLADLTRLSYPYIAQIETGYRLPATKHQIYLAKALGMSLDELFGHEDESPQAPERTTMRRRITMEEAVDRSVETLEALPPSVRLQALSQIQLRVMERLAGDLKTVL